MRLQAIIGVGVAAASVGCTATGPTTLPLEDGATTRPATAILLDEDLPPGSRIVRVNGELSSVGKNALQQQPGADNDIDSKDLKITQYEARSFVGVKPTAKNTVQATLTFMVTETRPDRTRLSSATTEDLYVAPEGYYIYTILGPWEQKGVGAVNQKVHGMLPFGNGKWHVWYNPKACIDTPSHDDKPYIGISGAADFDVVIAPIQPKQ